MTFIFPLLLSGLLLVGIPVLLHLIMQQKPKQLPFPAFRFLLQKHRTNQQRLRLRHWLLLALRMLLIGMACLALARPRIFNERLNLSSERPVAAVLVFDTSASMQYQSGGETRLEAAKKRALELLADLPGDSRVAVLETAEPGGEWLANLTLARERIAALKIRPANNPVTSRLGEAYRLLADLEQTSESADEHLPRFLYVFSDRTPNCWDSSRSKDLRDFRDRLAADVHGIFIDVGVEQPVDVALAAVQLRRAVLAIGEPAMLEVTVRSTGSECDTEVRCRLDGEKTPERKPVQLKPNQSQVLTFERPNLAPGFHQAEITLATEDSFPFDNALFATFQIRGGRRILTIVDEVADADFWKLALESTGFQCDVRRPIEIAGLSATELSAYQAIALLNVARPEHDLWERLAHYVAKGGGLAVIPGGEELIRKSYNEDATAQNLLPGQLRELVNVPEPGVGWKTATYQHPVMAPFREWSQNENVDFQLLPPAATHYWDVRKTAGAGTVVVSYGDSEQRPALLERILAGKKPGRVLLFTTPLDRRHLDLARPWNDYLKTSFYLVLVNKVMGYLAGDADEPVLNHVAGQPVSAPVTTSPSVTTFTLQGPQLGAAEAVVTHPEGQPDVLLPQAVSPGNYNLLDSAGKRVAAFSINLPPEESLLTRLPEEPIEDLLGTGAVLSVGHGTRLKEALEGRWKQPVELLPWLMILVLLGLAVENLLANKFYRAEAPRPEAPGVGAVPERQRRELSVPVG